MSFTTFKNWIEGQLSTMTDIYVYTSPTLLQNYPACFVEASGSEKLDQETNVNVVRRYDFVINFLVSYGENMQTYADADSIFFTKLDEIVTLFDDKNARPAGGNYRLRLENVTIQNVVENEPLKIARLNLSIVKLN